MISTEHCVSFQPYNDIFPVGNVAYVEMITKLLLYGFDNYHGFNATNGIVAVWLALISR